jgi:hypothetical protein
MKEINILHRTEDGEKLVYIPLKNSADYVVMEESGFELLTKLGVIPSFKINGYGNAVVYWSGGQHGQYIHVAWILLDCGRNEHVTYVDGFFNNLCRSNLIKTGGVGKHRARDLITEEFGRKQYTLRHLYAEA